MRSEKDLLDSAKKYSFRGRVDKSVFSGPVFVRGEGSTVEDVNGKEYLDFNSGQMCSALGHNHPTVTDAIKKSCDELIHAHSSFFNDQEIILAERLGALLPPPLEKSLFLGSGADANEAAVTIARKFTDGFEVASPHISFHGLSDTARSLTFAGWHSGHGPLSPGSMAMVAPYCYRCPLAQKFPDCEIACLDTSFELIDAQTTSKPAAVITEPLFSAGGVVEPPPGWLKKLKESCEERDMLLIVDDEQTGLGKLGTMFGFEKDEVVPDIVTLAKHFGGGVSISSVSTSAEVEEKIASTEFVVTHSHTNDPLACAAGVASLDVIEGEDVPAKARKIGAHLRERLTWLGEQYELVGDIRGRGLLQGIELVEDRRSKTPATRQGSDINRRCLENGLIFSQRRGGSVLRFVPPATTTEGQMDQAMDILTDAVDKASVRGAVSG